MSEDITKQNEQRVAVITGGSLGIGLSVTNSLLSRGWHVHVLARNASSTLMSSSKLHTHDIDVTNFEDIQRIADKVAAIEDGTSIDALILCAGGGMEKPLKDVLISDYREIIDTNLGGAVFTMRAFSSQLRDGKSLVCAISSIAGRRGFSDWTLYCAAKHGLEGFLSALRCELRKRRIRVTSIQPGSVDTPSYDHLSRDEKLEFINPDDVADLIVQTILLPPEAVVETLFINNSIGDL